MRYALGALLLVIFIFRINNAAFFNPYWGFDGGSHLDYIAQLAFSNTFPDQTTNIVAWHEPLYYLVGAGIAKIIGLVTSPATALRVAVFILQLTISSAFTYICLQLTRRITKKQSAILLSTALINFLPPVNEITMLASNELANTTWILLFILFVTDRWVSREPTKKDALLLGFIAGLALLTKITALVPLLLLVGYSAVTRKHIQHTIMVAAIALFLYAPWMIYKSNHGLTSASIGNHAFTPAQPLRLDKRILFYSKIDPDIFTYPVWYSGGTSFWSMIYADTVTDYYGLFENADRLTASPIDKKIATTHNNTYMSRYRFIISRFAIYIGIGMILIMLTGLYHMLRTRSHQSRLFAGLVLSLGAALIYFTYRYPYPELGHVKIIFITPALIPAIMYGIDMLQNRRSTFITIATTAYTIVFCSISATLFWILT